MTAYLAGVQEKLRRAELQSVEERPAAGLTTVAAAAVILLGLVGGGRLRLEPATDGYPAGQDGPRRGRRPGRAARLRGEARPHHRATPPGGPRRSRRPSGPRACWLKARPTRRSVTE